jgi:hypothetical protein
MKLAVLLLVLIFVKLAYSKEVFTEEKLKELITVENPYLYVYFGEIFIKKAKRKYYQGELDLKVAPTYENKDYPVSWSRFYSLYMKKRFLEGFDLLVGYRKALGIQEFSNIKTSDKGEFQFGVKLPIREITKGINLEKLNIDLADLDTRIAEQKFKDGLRKFYFKAISSYYKLLYYKKAYELEKVLLQKAKKRLRFVKEKIRVGVLPRVYVIEAEQHIISRKQRVLKAKQEYENALNEFFTLLNIDREKFFKKYTLPDIEKIFKQIPKKYLTKEEALKVALQNRPEFQALSLEKQKLERERKYYSILKYPKTDLSLYAVQDLKYKEGFKISFNMEYPVNRRKYLGKKLELNSKEKLIRSKIEKLKRDIQIELFNVINKLDTLKIQIKNAKREISLVKQLEEIEKEKFKHGVSTLFYINQREIYTQKTILKNLKYKLDYILNYKKYLNILNVDFKPAD